jgi:8-amino-7-oxononanoate synthase
MDSLDRSASERLAALEARTLRRALTPTVRGVGLWAERGGRRLLSFSCNDYLGLTQHPAVKAAAIAAIERYGAGSGASRLVTGNHPLYAQLETRLARLKGTDAACVFGSGYLVNAGVPQALVGPDDLILIDELAHSSLWTGARLSRAQVHAFRHNDASHAREILREHRAGHRHALLITEGVFSMDGDRAPLADLAALAEDFDVWTLVDDAHDLEFAHAAPAPLQIGTLSKAFGGYGGYLAASQPVIDLMKSRARTLIYSTGLPPSVVASAIAALDLIEADPALPRAPLDKARGFTRAAGLPEAQSAIVPVLIGAADDALAASRLLESEGFLVVAIRPPTVPEGTARLRIAFSSDHPDTEILRLADIVRTKVLRTV